MAKYPGKIPIICERDPRSFNIPDIDKKKYLVPSDLLLANFIYVIRSRLKLSPDKSIYLFINNTILPASCELLTTLYTDHADDDGFLYIKYAGENTFGA